ncbi:MAG: hypothetical protein KKE02_20840 [Alphaproteobacteria bacterium]|nr:hypothetical protein [Alphaproteobacteria bacterium]MBU1514518.1 hypothetical protein [Alphaproteobacteria bacterium]MBU2096850.1 hypothetical protein [Alphaproteobacteria bacterium]MBU2153477.1 hypothetical protein [Alphaproteobacteria bacterium]MBU2306018.1 hypothetical protein [Alphaproteobacteria bacterium]
MRFVYQNTELERELDGATTPDALEAVFQKIAQIPRLFRTPAIYGQKLFAKGFDALIPRVAARLRLEDQPSPPKSNDNVCILATRFYPSGGHTRVAQDIIGRLQPAGVSTVLTDITDELRYRPLLNQATNQTFLGERALVLLSSKLLVERVLETYMILKAMRPSRIVLMSHPMDIVAVLAAWPFRDIVEFVHHADHIPSLGATLPFSAHADLTYTCHLACREAGLDAVYAGMTAPTAQPTTPLTPKTGLRIATCGVIHKYQGKGRYRWADYAVAALRQPGVELVHIGSTDEAFQNELRNALGAAKISLDRYILAGFQPNLPAELGKWEADIYLSSYPEPGGKANLEAMSAGVPTIVPIDANLPPLIRYRLPMPHWVTVNRPDRLGDAIAEVQRLAATMGETERTIIAREAIRFDDFAAGRRPPGTPEGDRLP